MLYVPALGRLRRLFETVMRFAGVGVASSLLYALVVMAATSGLHVNPDVSSLLAYLVTIPINFLLHRNFTFHSQSDMRGDILRYAIVQVVSIAVSLVAMTLSVDVLHLPYVVGILGAIGLGPVITYLLMDRWAFACTAA